MLRMAPSDNELQAMLVSVPPEALAAVLMPAFLDDRDLSEAKLMRWLRRSFPLLEAEDWALEKPVREALQVLEHAELIYLSVMSSSPPYWRTTRLGILCLNEGEDAVRKCIEDRIAPQGH